ncbi:hypothetical protein CIPAW_07G027100 [Carya illinoinensis]|uniref:GRF-type domain-containing protein n=1 Tax=Carya illinoinensis TaxID=32201 RepID=A0A8T1PZ26_CARIL|nr:hypothetical protein CIPAW_07G027100 [Carya illinoinensis]
MMSKENVSSSISSSSIVKHTLENTPVCTCGSPASLRTSNTRRNPGRAFFGCSNYNMKGLPHCNFFKWADSGQEREQELVKIETDLLRKKDELQKTQEEFQKTREELQKLEEEVRKTMEEIRHWMEEVRKREGEIVKMELEVRRQRTHLRICWAILILLYLLYVRS